MENIILLRWDPSFFYIQFNLTIHGFNITSCGLNLISIKPSNESLKWNSSLLDISLIHSEIIFYIFIKFYKEQFLSSRARGIRLICSNKLN